MKYKEDAIPKIQYSTYVYKILEKSDQKILLQSITDTANNYTHDIKPFATFPYNELVIGEIYTVVGIRWKWTWHWAYAWPMNKSHIIYNHGLMDHIKEKFDEDLKI